MHFECQWHCKKIAGRVRAASGELYCHYAEKYCGEATCYTVEESRGREVFWGLLASLLLRVSTFLLFPFVFISFPKHFSLLQLFLVTVPTSKSLHMWASLNILCATSCFSSRLRFPAPHSYPPPPSSFFFPLFASLLTKLFRWRLYPPCAKQLHRGLLL